MLNTPSGCDLFDNIMVASDSYKVSHRRQYPPGTTVVSSYLESRGGEYKWTQFVGLQYLLKRYLSGPVITPKRLDYAESVVVPHLGGDHELFGRDRWKHIIQDHNGRLPIHIKAVPEGLRVPTHNVLMTVTNTCDQCFWLTNYLETLLVETWYPITVATLSQHFRHMLRHYLNLTGSNPDALMWMLHDFGFRGVSSPESAAWGSFAHLTTGFRGTDTMFALIMGKEFYDEPCAGYSIPAYEHSTVTSWGRNREIECYRHALQVHPKGPLSVVSDSYNFFNAVENIWGGLLRDEVLSRDGRLVIRPDSFEDIPAGVRRTLDILGQKFPTTINEKGYRVLHPKIRIIQGDGVDQETAKAVLKAIIVDDPIHGKWAAENVCFGMGGALLQKVNRDTLKFAFKCWMALVNGERVAVYKQPEGMEFKKSKAGEHKLVLNNGKFQTVPLDAEGDDILRTVFYNGDLPCCWSLEQIRERADLPMGIIGY